MLKNLSAFADVRVMSEARQAVEVEVVGKKLARLECRVLELALCLRRAYAHDNKGYSEY